MFADATATPRDVTTLPAFVARIADYAADGPAYLRLAADGAMDGSPPSATPPRSCPCVKPPATPPASRPSCAPSAFPAATRGDSGRPH